MPIETASDLLNALLFRDNNGNAYSDDCVQNRIIRKVAAQYGIPLSLKDADASEKARKRFGKETMA